MEDASIHLAEALVKVDNSVSQPLVHSEICSGREEPAIAKFPLVDVEPISTALHKPWFTSQLPRPFPLQVIPTLAEEHARPVSGKLRVFPESAGLQAGCSKLLKVLPIQASVNSNRLGLVKVSRSDPGRSLTTAPGLSPSKEEVKDAFHLLLLLLLED